MNTEPSWSDFRDEEGSTERRHAWLAEGRRAWRAEEERQERIETRLAWLAVAIFTAGGFAVGLTVGLIL